MRWLAEEGHSLFVTRHVGLWLAPSAASAQAVWPILECLEWEWMTAE